MAGEALPNMSSGPISPISGQSTSSNATFPQSLMTEEQPTTNMSGRLERPLSMSMYSTLPEAVPRPLESEKQVAGDEGKEVVASDGKEAALVSATGGLTYPGSPELPASKPEQPYAGETYREYDSIAPDGHPALATRPEEKKRRTVFGLTPLVFGAIVGGIIIVAIALGVGLGVGLSAKNNAGQSSSTSTGAAFPTSLAPSATPTVVGQTLIGGAVSPQYYSTQGVFNGTGLDINSYAFIGDFPGLNGSQAEVIVYFQHYTGDLRWAGLNASGWYGGGSDSVIATDAKNNTPITTAAYKFNSTDYWRLFYINNQNLVRERVLNATTSKWYDGNLNKLNVKALNDERVGLLNCYYLNPSADTEFAGDSGVGLRLWVASNTTTFQQLGWSASTDAWTFAQTWPGLNGHATPACYSFGGPTTYVAFVDLTNRVNFFWRDTSSGVIPTEAHPINQWTNSSVSIPNVNPSTQLNIGVFANNIIWAQSLQSNLVQGYNVTWAAENTTVDVTNPIVISGRASAGNSVPLNGSSLALTVLPQTGSDLAPRIILFDQIVGNEISFFTQYSNQLSSGAGTWNVSSVNLPRS